MAWLIVVKGPDKGRRFEIATSGLTLGRDARNPIRLNDNEISRCHARIDKSGNQFRIEDLRSSNGTWVNGKQVQACLLKTGDHIIVGQSELLLTSGQQRDEVRGKEDALSSQIAVVTTKKGVEDTSAIVRSISQREGQEFLRHPERAGSDWLQGKLLNLAVMYETSQAISRISDIGELLDFILSLVFQSVPADRGAILLKERDVSELRPTAIRFAKRVGPEEKITLSQSIVECVLRTNDGVIVLDASSDDRFHQSQSIKNLGIREAICVPLKGRHDTLGVIYIDTTTNTQLVLENQQPAKFTDDHLKLMIAIAHQAGLAIEDSRLYDAMVSAERLAAIGQTIATLSHHIKNILQGVRSGNDVVEMGLKEENLGLVRAGWQVVGRNQERIYNLVMDMLSYSKDRDPVLDTVPLADLVEDVISLMRGRARDAGVEFEVKLDPNIPDVPMDFESMHRALLNIVTNAIDAVHEVDSPRVRVEVLRERPDWATIAIEDNGPGIPEDKQESIFQVFVSTKGSKGTGLGLAVSKKIVQEHGGRIRLTSRLGAGSRFAIDLPIRPAGSSAVGSAGKDVDGTAESARGALNQTRDETLEFRRQPDGKPVNVPLPPRRPSSPSESDDRTVDL